MLTEPSVDLLTSRVPPIPPPDVVKEIDVYEADSSEVKIKDDEPSTVGFCDKVNWVELSTLKTVVPKATCPVLPRSIATDIPATIPAVFETTITGVEILSVEDWVTVVWLNGFPEFEMDTETNSPSTFFTISPTENVLSG